MNIWFETRPNTSYPVDRVVEETVETEVIDHRSARTVTVEWQRAEWGHPSSYGLLGASFEPENSGILRVQVAIAPRHGWPGDGVNVRFATRWRGTRHERHARAILAAVMGPGDAPALGPGVLRFDHAIEDGGASSPMMFGWLGLIIVRLMIHDGALSEEQREELLRTAVIDATRRVNQAPDRGYE